MSLSPDQIVDRLKLKKQLMSWRMVAVVTITMLVLSLFAGSELKKTYVIEGEHIARIYVDGVIDQDVYREDALKRIADDANISGVIMHMNSPGGTAVGGESLYRAVRKVAVKKPVVVVMGDMATSAGYMVSAAADYLISHELSLTGSIGVIAMSYEYTDLAEKLGVKFHNFKSSPLKGGPIPTEKLTPEMEQAMNATILDTYDFFFNLVSERRKIARDVLRPIANGQAYTGRQALAYKLIDALGDEDDAVAWLKNVKRLPASTRVRDYDIEEQKSKVDRFLESMHNVSAALKMILNNNLTYFL